MRLLYISFSAAILAASSVICAGEHEEKTGSPLSLSSSSEEEDFSNSAYDSDLRKSIRDLDILNWSDVETMQDGTAAS